MTQKSYNKAKSDADKLVSKIDSFIDSIIEENKWSSNVRLIMKRLLKKSDEDDIEDICFEMDIEANIKTFKIDSLAQELKLESFLQEIADNPYQLKLIA